MPERKKHERESPPRFCKIKIKLRILQLILSHLPALILWDSRAKDVEADLPRSERCQKCKNADVIREKDEETENEQEAIE